MTRAEDEALLGPVAVAAAKRLAAAAPHLTEQGRAVLAAILRRPDTGWFGDGPPVPGPPPVPPPKPATTARGARVAPAGARAFTVAQVAEQLQLPPYQVYSLIHKQEIKAIRLGRHWRIPDHELERLLGGGRA